MTGPKGGLHTGPIAAKLHTGCTAARGSGTAPAAVPAAPCANTYAVSAGSCSCRTPRSSHIPMCLASPQAEYPDLDWGSVNAGDTPLHVAAARGSIEGIRILLKGFVSGADAGLATCLCLYCFEDLQRLLCGRSAAQLGRSAVHRRSADTGLKRLAGRDERPAVPRARAAAAHPRPPRRAQRLRAPRVPRRLAAGLHLAVRAAGPLCAHQV